MTQNVSCKFDSFLEKQKLGMDLIHHVSSLTLNKGVNVVLFRNSLLNQSLSEVVRLHEENLTLAGICISLTTRIVKILTELELECCTVDIGKLAAKSIQLEVADQDLKKFVESELSELLVNNKALEAQDVILYGFGRIGRLLCRELIKQAGRGQQLRLRAIVLRQVDAKSLAKRASLLNKDSVHGAFEASIEVHEEQLQLCINGQVIQFIEAATPESVDYTSYGINNAIVIDNTGAFRDREALSRHLQAKGASKVLLTAPGDGVENIVFGVNQALLDLENETVFSSASCTTNAITPILSTIEEAFGIEQGHIETIHAYTNDQNLLDNMHKKPRRGRSAAINMVLTTTGAGKAVAKAVPSLANKLTSHAVRVPTPNGSLAILKLTLSKNSSVEEINTLIREASLDGALSSQIDYSAEPELVSADIIGNKCCSVFDSEATLVGKDGKAVVLYVWYDNEQGYTMQVMRLAKYITGVFRPVY